MIDFINRNLIKITLWVFFIVVVLANALVSEPGFNNTNDKISYMVESGNYSDAETEYLDLLAIDSTNIDLHYQYINNHYNIDNTEHTRDDETILRYYTDAGPTGLMADIGNYGVGLIESKHERYSSAVHEFAKVKNRELKYLNNSTGYALMYSSPADINPADLNIASASTHLTQSELDSIATACFMKEINLGGNLGGAYTNLARMHRNTGNSQALYDMIADEKAAPYLPVWMKRELYFKDFKIVDYAQALLANFRGVNLWGFLAALLIMVSWVFFFRKVDVYESEKWMLIMATVLMGMIGTEFVYPLSDFLNINLGFNLNGALLNDFMYCFIGIGIVEEFVKILPLLFLLKYTKAINEPFDYILYGSLSALGFAFVENLMYFTEGNLEIIHGRALIAVVSHMFDTSLIAYGLMLNRYKRHYNPYLNLLCFFLLAALFHGFYDFWLINQTVNSFKFISLILAFAQVQLFNIFMNNALNHSGFYDKAKSLDNLLLRNYLVSSLAAVLMLEYIALALRWSPDRANTELLASLQAGTWIILFLSRTLSRFKLTKGIWAPEKPYLSEDDSNDFLLNEGIHVQLDIMTSNSYTNSYLPNNATIMHRLRVSGEPYWFLARLDKPGDADSYLSDRILIRIKDPQNPLSMTEVNYFGFFLIPENLDLKRPDLERTDLIFCGWTVLKIMEEAAVVY